MVREPATRPGARQPTDRRDQPEPAAELTARHVVHAREEGIITREGLVPLARKLWLEGPSSTDAEFEERLEWFAQQAKKAGFTPTDTGAVEAAVEEVVAENMDMIGERGMGAMGPLMGAVMQKLGGSADGKTVSEALRKKISELDD